MHTSNPEPGGEKAAGSLLQETIAQHTITGPVGARATILRSVRSSNTKYAELSNPLSQLTLREGSSRGSQEVTGASRVGPELLEQRSQPNGIGPAAAADLVKRGWDGQRERCDLRVEAAAVRAHHAVGAVHGPDGRGQRTEARVLERLPGGEHRLLANDARAHHALLAAVAVRDDPLAAQ